MSYQRLSEITSKEFSEAVQKLEERYRIKCRCIEADANADFRKIAGTEYTRNPDIPANPLEAFQLFKDYYAMVQFESQKHFFLSNYHAFNRPSIEAELTEIQDWIRMTENQSYSVACKIIDYSNPQHEYLRLVNGYYEGTLMTWEHHQTHKVPAEVYGRYVLFYSFLQETLEALEKNYTYQPGEIDRILLMMGGGQLRDFYKKELDAWYDQGFNARVKMYGSDVSELAHCERELLMQKAAYEDDLARSINHDQFNVRMLFSDISEKRRKYIMLIEDKIEDLKYPEVPFIGIIINANRKNMNHAILDRYYSLMPQSLEPDAFGIVSKWANQPYAERIFGAWVLSRDWEELKSFWDKKSYPFDIVPNEKVNDALKDYSRGFRKGYYSFEKELLGVDSITGILSNNNLPRIVFDCVFADLPVRVGFSISYDHGDDYFVTWYKSGIEAGRYYRAWYVIMEYYFLFEKLFSVPEIIPFSVQEDQSNDFEESTIADFLDEFKETNAISNKDYDALIKQFLAYFRNEPHKKLQPVFVRSRNKKRLAYACGEIFRSTQTGRLSFDYLNFLRETFEPFKEEKIDKDAPNRSNLYKYCTEKNHYL